MKSTYYAESKSEAILYLKQNQGKNIVNINDGTVARYGTNGREKMVSNKARQKSLSNGFTSQEHNTAAANIATLYEHGVKIIERPDRKGNSDVTIRYYETHIEFVPSGIHGYAQIIMKMNQKEGNTLYSIELVGIKSKSDLIGEPLSIEAIRASDSIVKLPSKI